MVDVRKAKLSIVMEVHIPEDIVKDYDRYTNVKDGILRSMSKGLYDQGIDFRIINSNFEISTNQP